MSRARIKSLRRVLRKGVHAEAESGPGPPAEPPVCAPSSGLPISAAHGNREPHRIEGSGDDYKQVQVLELAGTPLESWKSRWFFGKYY